MKLTPPTGAAGLAVTEARAPGAAANGRAPHLPARLALVHSDGLPSCPQSARASLETWAVWYFTTVLGFSPAEAREFLGLAGESPRPAGLRVVR